MREVIIKAKKKRKNKVLYDQPFEVTAFHSCDKEVGLKVLNGEAELDPSDNSWDWLANGIYFWEQNPSRALEYARESAQGHQFNKVRITTPFVIGATIELGNCLNLVEPKSLQILKEAYRGLQKVYKELNKKMPVNKGNNRALDCAVIKYVHQTRKEEGKQGYDTIRCAFTEGVKVYPKGSFTSRHHIQIAVINPLMIKSYFLPRPVDLYNPYLRKDFIGKQKA